MDIKSFLNGMAVQHKYNIIHICTKDHNGIANVTWIGNTYVIQTTGNYSGHDKAKILCAKIFSIQNNINCTEIIINI